MSRDYRNLPDEALLRVKEIAAPAGPVPFRRAKFLELVKAGEAPAPVRRSHNLTVWRWADIRTYLNEIAGTPPT